MISFFIFVVMMEKEMSFWEHLEELRMVLFKIVGVLAVGFVLFFILLPRFYDSVIMAPCSENFSTYRFLRQIDGSAGWLPSFITEPGSPIKVVNIQMASQFRTHISLSFWLSLMAGFPWVIYFLWTFIAPALGNRAKTEARIAFWAGTLLFATGILLGYFVIFPFTLRFLVDYQLGNLIENQLSLDSYISNFLLLIFLMGVIFELPLLCKMLSSFGLLSRQTLIKYRKHAIIFLLFLAALITPTGDPFTLTLVFLPLFVLYQMSIFIVKNRQ